MDTIRASKGLEATAVLLHTGYLSGLVTGLADYGKHGPKNERSTSSARPVHLCPLILFGYIAPPWPGFGRPT
ncbi:MAG: hypothetical protein RJR34_00035 [Candidatus Methanoculleus thermohydrogenotrophicum]|nr:hypothetical protein [Candidatus Methanoculleus thermohydrogenotrophicum]